jgi:glycosyltransferase involved in cell wall biosynthesis
LERQLYYLLSNLDLERYPSAVVVWSYREDDFYVQRIKSLGAAVYEFNPTWSRLEKFTRFTRIVRKLQPEVVHSYSIHTNVAAWWAARCCRTVGVGSYRSEGASNKEGGGHLLGALSMRLPRSIIANSRAAVHNAGRLGWTRPRTLVMVRNGIDLSLFNAAVPLPHIPTMICIGTLKLEKRWDMVLRAAAKLQRSGIEFRIRLVGEGRDRSALTELADQLGLGQQTEFLGQRMDVPELLSQSSVLVHASDREGCPNVVMEAMAASRAVVATNAGDVAELVEDGVSGYVIPRGDESKLVERLHAVLKNPELCASMGKSGRQRAEREFRLDRLIAETLEAYRTSGWRDSQG